MRGNPMATRWFEKPDQRPYMNEPMSFSIVNGRWQRSNACGPGSRLGLATRRETDARLALND